MLGKALGIPESSVRTYTEAEIRAGYDNASSLHFIKRKFIGIIVYSVFNRVYGLLSCSFLDYGFHYNKL